MLSMAERTMWAFHERKMLPSELYGKPEKFSVCFNPPSIFSGIFFKLTETDLSLDNKSKNKN